MKTLFSLSALALAASMSLPAMAHVEIDSHCDVDINGHLTYQRGDLTVELNNGDEMLIDAQHNLYINGEKISLANDEQRWVDAYYTEIKSAIPLTVNIAAEGIEIASVTVTEVFGELLGTDDELIAEFNSMFDTMSEEIQAKFYAEDGSYMIDTRSMEQKNWFSGEWEEEFEERLEELVSDSMGRILIAVGSQMLMGGGDMDAFGEKMERFGETIEQRVETRTQVIEEKADELCAVLAKADYAENKLQKHVEGLETLNLLDLENYDRQM